MKSATSPRCEARKPRSVSMPRDTKNSAANTSRTGITSERARRPAQSDSLSTSPATNAPSGADSPPQDVSAAAPSAAPITVTTNDSRAPTSATRLSNQGRPSEPTNHTPARMAAAFAALIASSVASDSPSPPSAAMTAIIGTNARSCTSSIPAARRPCSVPSSPRSLSVLSATMVLLSESARPAVSDARASQPSAVPMP